MPDALSITASSVDPGLLTLPWSTPLGDWPSSTIVSLPKGLSRHLVRFASLSGRVVAIKETTEEMARREYDMLGNLARLDAPCVERVAVIARRTDAAGEPLPAALVTAHLKFSLPYRALFTQVLRPDTATRLVDALAALLVRLHNVGFFWGDVSLSNTLFRRDAGAFAAYLVDAETGELHECGLTRGQREHDLDVARTNIAGEIMDLEAGGRLEGGVDAIAIADGIVSSYHSLWTALTDAETFTASRGLAHHRARAPPQRPRLRHRRDVDRADGGRHEGLDPAEGRRCRAPPAAAAAADGSRRRGEPGAPPAQRPRRVPRPRLTPGRRRGDGRPRVAHARLRARREGDPVGSARQARARRGVPPGARAPLVHVAGARAGRFRSPRCSRATSTTCCATAATRRPSWVRRPRRCRCP